MQCSVPATRGTAAAYAPAAPRVPVADCDRSAAEFRSEGLRGVDNFVVPDVAHTSRRRGRAPGLHRGPFSDTIGQRHERQPTHPARLGADARYFGTHAPQ